MWNKNGRTIYRQDPNALKNVAAPAPRFGDSPDMGHHIGSNIKSRSYRDPHAAKVPTTSAPPTIVHLAEMGTVPTDVAPLPGTAVNTTNTVTTTTTRLVEDYHDRYRNTAAPVQPSGNFTNVTPGVAVGGQTTAAPGYVDPRASQVYIVHEHRPDGNPLVEAITTVAKGDLPHNLQASQIIDTALMTLEAERMNDPYLNARGKNIARHTEDLLLATKDFIYMKNSDEKLQQIIKEAGLAGAGVTTGVASTNLPSSQLKNQANESLFLARSLFREVLHSKDFRMLLIDTFDLLQTIFGNKMQGGGSQLKDMLSQKIQSGESVRDMTRGIKNMIFSKGGSNKNPITSGIADTLRSATTSSNVMQQQQVFPQQQEYVQQPVTLTSQIRVISSDPDTRVEIIDAPQDQLLSGLSSGTQSSFIGGQTFDRAVGTEGLYPISSSVIPPSTFSTVLPGTTTTTVQQPAVSTSSSGFLAGLSDQQKREFAIKLRGLLIRYGEREEFKRAARSIFRLMKLASASGTQIRSNGVRGNDNMQNLWIDLQDFVERFTGGKSVRPLIKHFKKLSFMMRNDATSVAWFRDFRKYAITTFEDPRTLEDETRVAAMMQLIDRGRELYNSPQYRQYTNGITWESRELLDRIRNDPNRKAISRALGKLSTDLLYDMKGQASPTALQDSLGQLRLLMVPVLLSQLQNVNLPRIEGYTPKMDYAISNVVFNGDDILPQHLRLTMENDFDINILQLGTDQTRHKLILSIQNIRTVLDNIHFAYRKKTFPRLNDEGIVDVGLLGAGTSVLVEWRVESGGGLPMRFFCTKASCVIDDLLINIKSANHGFLDRLAAKLFKNTVRSKLEMALADKLLDFGTSLSDKLNLAIRNRDLSRQKIRGYSTGNNMGSFGYKNPLGAVTAIPKHDVHTSTVTQTTLRSV